MDKLQVYRRVINNNQYIVKAEQFNPKLVTKTDLKFIFEGQRNELVNKQSGSNILTLMFFIGKKSTPFRLATLIT